MNRSIATQVKIDIKVARKIWLPWRVLLPWGVFCLAVIVVCDRIGKLNMSLPLLNCIAVFALLVYLKWDLRRQPLFWTVLVALAAIHAVLIWYLPWTSKWVPAIAIAGISSIDFVLMLLILATIEALLDRRATAEE